MTVAAGIAILLLVGREPQTVIVMSPSNFDGPEQIGEALFKRLHSQIAEEKIVAFGVPGQPDWHRAIVRGFLAAATAEKIPFDLIIAEERMPVLDVTGLGVFEMHMIATNTKTQSEFVELMQTARAAGKRVLIYTASVFTTRLISGNSIDRYEMLTGEELMTISSGTLALRSNQEFLIDPPCLGSERDQNGTSPLGCGLIHASRQIYRKHLPNDRYVAIMNSPRPRDYLLLVSSPGQTLKAAGN
jgi:hypothetical protein